MILQEKIAFMFQYYFETFSKIANFIYTVIQTSKIKMINEQKQKAILKTGWVVLNIF